MVWPYRVDAALLAAVAIAARTPLSLLAGRLAIEAPFVLFVVVLPFAADGRAVAGVRHPGQGDARGAGDGCPGVDDARARHPARRRAAARATHADRDRRLRAAVPAGLLDELRRMRLARVQRGDDPRWLWQARGTGAAGRRARRAHVRARRAGARRDARARLRRPDAGAGARARRAAAGLGGGRWASPRCRGS